MKSFWIAGILAAALAFSAPEALAQARAIPTDDPAAFARTISHQVVRDRTEPLRRTMIEMTGTADLPADVDAAIIAMERHLDGAQADQAIMLEDTHLQNTLRSIYYLHTFGDRFMYTRFDFMRYADGWKLMNLKFSGRWEGIVHPTTPGWRPTQ